jgi:putative ABC transport system permease protein
LFRRSIPIFFININIESSYEYHPLLTGRDPGYFQNPGGGQWCGLAKFSNQRRTKEIGIRKIIGASVAQIYSLLTKDIFVLIFISLLIASPVAWIFMNKWLQNFAYRITISWWIFVVAGSLPLLIALLTVSYLVIKAALANPVESLRNE